MEEFKTWFEKKYIAWLSNRNRRGSLREFSEWMGVSQSVVSNWMSGQRKPSAEYADIICIHFDYDMAVYDLLGLPRPPKELLQFKALWPVMSERDKSEIGKFLEKVEQRNATSHKRQPLPDT